MSEERDYVADGDGPVQDTDVFSKGESDVQPQRPSHIDARSRNEVRTNPDDPLRQLRQRAVEHGSGAKRLRLTMMVGLFVGIVAVTILALGAILGLEQMLNPPVEVKPPPVERPPPPDEIDGVPVRKGLKGGPNRSRPKPVPPE